MNHYGQVDLIGNPLAAALPLLAANTHKLSVAGAIDAVVGKDWGTGDAFDRPLDIAPVRRPKPQGLRQGHAEHLLRGHRRVRACYITRSRSTRRTSA
jgi:hypothetical protein